MFQINSTSNEIVQLVPKRFSDIGFTERGHLQEWIAKMPECLGEELRMENSEWRKRGEDHHFADVGKMVQEGVSL